MIADMNVFNGNLDCVMRISLYVMARLFFSSTAIHSNSISY